MAKQYKNLWPKLVDYANLQEAFRKAARGKRKRKSVAAFEEELESNLLSLQFELEEGLYQPGGYLNFYIHDPKRRLISAAPFRDRVIHHAFVNVIGPIYERKFIFDTYANRSAMGRRGEGAKGRNDNDNDNDKALDGGVVGAPFGKLRNRGRDRQRFLRLFPVAPAGHDILALRFRPLLF